MTSNVALLTQWHTSSFVGSNVSEVWLAFRCSLMIRFHLSLSWSPFEKTKGTKARIFCIENAGVATRRWRLWIWPSAASIPHPMRPVISLLDCQGFSYIVEFFSTCPRATGSRVKSRWSHYVTCAQIQLTFGTNEWYSQVMDPVSAHSYHTVLRKHHAFGVISMG